jgi:hypothetical protein
MNLLVVGWRLRQRLVQGDTKTLPWQFDERKAFLPYRRGQLQVWRNDIFENFPFTTPGVQYTSAMGANSDDSYSGFLPYVTFEEALLLVHKPWRKSLSDFTC